MPLERLSLFAKPPLAGQVKTRLIPRLGSQGALELYLRLCGISFQLARDLAQQRGVELALWHSSAEPGLLADWARGMHLYPQPEADLGQRMHQAFVAGAAQGVTRQVIIGMDCPQLTLPILQNAFDSLENHDLVLGPALDGGYYLIGLAKPFLPLFAGVAWSTDQVLNQTLDRANAGGLRSLLLEPLSDLDEPADLDRFPWLLAP